MAITTTVGEIRIARPFHEKLRKLKHNSGRTLKAEMEYLIQQETIRQEQVRLDGIESRARAKRSLKMLQDARN